MRESMPAGTAAWGAREKSEASDLQILEQALGPGGSPENPHGLRPDPIRPEWILEGKPSARRKLLVGSSDNLASTHMWDCTSGRVNWDYDEDEVIYVVEGSVVVEGQSGERQHLGPGDTFLFPAGTRYHWIVPQYIRKIAFLHAPLSRKMRLARRIYGLFKPWAGRKQPGERPGRVEQAGGPLDASGRD